MAINKNKAMEAAQKFVEKGQLDKAIKEYAKIVEEDPKDVRVWLKLGDLYAKKGAKPEATETYLRVAQFYSDQGFYLKAVAVYKQVLKLDPRLIEVNIKLAEVYRQLGLLSDAMQQYELVAAFYHREGKTREALSTIRELVEIDPDNVATRIKLAELYSKEQMVKEAVAEFAKAAEYLRTHGRLDDFIKVAERLVWHQPDNHPMNRELAGLYLKRNDPRHALQKLQACFKADARDVETLALLAAAFLALDQKPKTVSVWKELARVLTENHQAAQAAEVYRRILSLVPDDPEALAAVGGRQAAGTGQARAIPGVGAAAPPPSLQTPPVQRASVQMPAAGIPAGSEPGERPTGPRVSMAARGVPSMEAAPLVTMRAPTRQVEPVVGGPASARNPTPMPPAYVEPSEPGVEPEEDAVAIEVDEAGDQTMQNRRGDATVEATIDADFELPDARSGERDEKIAKLIAEADVYIKYSIRDRAIAHLGKVLELDPDNIEAHERLKDLYLAQNRKAEAALALAKLIELVTTADGGGADQAEPYLAELATLDPEAASALAGRYGRPTAVMDAGSAPAVSLDSVDVMIEPPSVQTLAVDAGSGDEGTDVGEEFHEVATDGAPEGTIDLGEIAELEVGDDQVESEEVSHPDLAFEDNASTAGGGEPTYDISMEAPALVDAARSLDDLDGLGGDAELPAQEFAIDPGDDAIEESIGVEVDPEEEGGKAAGSLEDDLDEADFFVTQGLIEEARTILLELLRRHPNHPLVGAKLRDLEGREGILVPPTEPPGPRTAALAAATASAGATVSMPDAPRRVIAKPLGGTDADTHYDLGLAYKEMGLLEEAIKEFELVRETPGRAVQCHLMIGLCHVQRGKLQEAVDEFKSGLYVDGITDREALALYFELGAAYEGLGDEREALYYYEKVMKRDPRFRDIGRRIESLGGAERSGGNGQRATARADGSGDEEMNAIDSLLGENEV